MITPLKRIGLSHEQSQFILKAIWNISTLYDFDLSDKEFKENYDITKKELIEQTNKLSEDLRR